MRLRHDSGKEIRMNKFLSILCMIFASGCAGSIDMRSLVERLDRAERRAVEAEARAEAAETRADDVRDSALAGPPPTSGGSATTVARPTSAPIIGAPLMGATMVPVASMPGVVPMCDGVDSSGMLMSGMLTSSMAFAPGSEPASFRGATGLTYGLANSSTFEIVLVVDGRMVHHFDGGFSPMQVDTAAGVGSECAAPVLPSRFGSMSPRRSSIAFIDNPEAPEHEVVFYCYRSAGGRLATRPAYQGSFIARPGGFHQFTNAGCGDYYNP